jgi:hypothetical protein
MRLFSDTASSCKAISQRKSVPYIWISGVGNNRKTNRKYSEYLHNFYPPPNILGYQSKEDDINEAFSTPVGKTVNAYKVNVLITVTGKRPATRETYSLVTVL